jgi:hypothetical protein
VLSFANRRRKEQEIEPRGTDNNGLALALREPELSPRELAVAFVDQQQ